MITKERLEELIKQGATIYNVCWYNVYEEKLGSNHFVGIADDEISLMQRYNGYERELIDHAKNLFETKEEAEWFAEFGDIERTERLELPTWEYVNKPHNIIVPFINKDGLMCNLTIENYENKITVNGVGGCYDIWDLTKENYTLACRKAKELFLGENNNDT